MKPADIVVLISGSGRTLQNLIERSEAGDLPVRIRRVVSSHPEAYGLERARNAGIPASVVDWREHRGDPEEFSRRISEEINRESPDLVCMAGFIRLWKIPPQYEGKVINIHPALLPKYGGRGFYGLNVHRAVIEAGETQSGCTVHYCDNRYDQGPVILQRKVPVLPDDTPETLAERVFEAEKEAYPEAIRRVTSGDVLNL